MKIVIVGIGGVGGVVGGRLAAGLYEDPDHEVVFWCRGQTLERIRDQGLTVLGSEGKVTVRPAMATHSAEDVGEADLVVFATKGYNLEEAARGVFPIITEKTAVIPLLNGIEAGSVLERHLPKSDVLGGCIYVSAHVENPGTVRQVGSMQRILFGKRGLDEAENRGRYSALEQLLKKSGMDIVLTDQIDVEMWAKFIFLSPFAGATTLFRYTIGETLANSESFETVRSMIAEVEALARAKAVGLPENIAGLTIEKARSFPPSTKTSMQLDQEKGNLTEIKSIIAYVCSEGRKHSVPTPTYDTVYGSLKEVCPLGI